MLQLPQLEEVSVRYAEEIAELRDFLAKAGCPVGTTEILGRIAARLPQDRAFRRDLTSHVWVLIDRYDRKISYSDLLGVLAVAAAGTRFAAEAKEDDAHDLLRFLMEARRSLDTKPDTKPGAQPNLKPDTKPEEREVAPPLRMEFRSLEVPQNAGGGRRRAAWISAACVVVALLLGLWLYHRHTAENGNTTAATASDANGSGASTSLEKKDESQPSPSAEVAGMEAARLPEVRTAPQSLSSRATARTPREVPEAAPRVPSSATLRPPAAVGESRIPMSNQAVVAVPPAVWTASRPPAPLFTPHATSTAKGAASAVPAGTLSKRLDSPTLPAYAIAEGAEGRKWPHLLRRRTGSDFAGVDAGLLAERQPTGVSAVSGASRSGSSNAASAGTVRPISVGVMAGNLLYSPSPAYPAAASAAHVQGEVRVQAQVDREGNVASARVVSGPPLLRDAALDAVQHWRYRPYLSSGKPIPMSTTAVVDFELP
jgi:TonB family protein